MMPPAGEIFMLMVKHGESLTPAAHETKVSDRLFNIADEAISCLNKTQNEL